MKYLGYAEVIEGGSWKLSKNLEELKGAWCFSMRIFETPDLTQNELEKIQKPRYPKIASKYKLVYSEGSLMHEKDIPDLMETEVKTIDDI
jgi:hypothetical protein